jgi:hypothetical protein
MYEKVPGDLATAFRADLRNLLNKGALSILFRSLFSRVRVRSGTI